MSSDRAFEDEFERLSRPTPIRSQKGYEKRYNCKLLHIPQEKTKTSFFDEMWSSRTLGQSEATQFVTKLNKIPEEKNVHIILKTNGGTLRSTQVIVNALLSFPGEVHVFVLDYAMSAGTIICLAADKVYMSPCSHLGMIDPQMTSGGFSLNFMGGLGEIEIETPFLRDIIRMASVGMSAPERDINKLLNKIAESKGWSDSFHGVCKDRITP